MFHVCSDILTYEGRFFPKRKIFKYFTMYKTWRFSKTLQNFLFSNIRNNSNLYIWLNYYKTIKTKRKIHIIITCHMFANPLLCLQILYKRKFFLLFLRLWSTIPSFPSEVRDTYHRPVMTATYIFRYVYREEKTRKENKTILFLLFITNQSLCIVPL